SRGGKGRAHSENRMARRPRGRAARERRHGARPSRWPRRDREARAPAEDSMIATEGMPAMSFPRSKGSSVVVAIVALLVVWRIVASGYATFFLSSGLDRAKAPVDIDASDAVWRARLARNPTDFPALVILALNLERQGKLDEAGDAMREAL